MCDKKKSTIKHLESVSTFNPQVKDPHLIFGEWCRQVFESLQTTIPDVNERANFYRALRNDDGPLQHKVRAIKWASEKPKLVVDAIEGIDWIVTSKGDLFGSGLMKLLPAAFKGGSASHASFKTVVFAGQFLCAALECQPNRLLQQITNRKEDIDALNEELAANVGHNLREHLYCLITFLQVDKEAKSVRRIARQAAENRSAKQTHSGSDGNAAPFNGDIRPQKYQSKLSTLHPAVFYSYIRSLYRWQDPFWQTPARKIKFHFDLSADELKAYLDALEQANKNPINKDGDSIDVEAQSHESSDGDEDNESEDDRVANALALSFVRGLKRDDLANPTKSRATLLISLYEGYYQYCSEHAINDSPKGAVSHAKNHKFSVSAQSRTLNAFPQRFERAFADKNYHKLNAYIAERMKTRETNAKLLSTPARFFVAALRAGFSQGLGRSAGALLGLYVLANIGEADIYAVTIPLFVTQAFLLASSTAYFAYRQNRTADPRNDRRITKAFFWTATAFSLTTPIVALGCMRLSEDVELEIEGLMARNASANASESDVARLNFLSAVQEAGGPAAWLLGTLVASSLAKIVRQFFQSATVSEHSAGLSIAYLDNTPLTDDDREMVNAARDGLYIASTTALLGALAFVPISPTVWSGVVLSLFNEAIDEINPDLAILLATHFRGASATYKGSYARFKVTRGSNSPAASLDAFVDSYLPQAASRLTVSGLSDSLSQIGDILKLQNFVAGSQVCKMLSVIFSGVFGARRGLMAGYMWGTAKPTMPSGLPSLLLRWKWRDAIGRIQDRPAVRTDLISLAYDNNRFKDQPDLFSWERGRSLSIDGRQLANQFPRDEYNTFHQCEHEHVQLAVVNMLIMHLRNDPLLLFSRSDPGLQNLSLNELANHANELQDLERSALVPLPKMTYAELSFDRQIRWKESDFDDVPVACVSYKDVDSKRRAVFVRCVTEADIEATDEIDEPGAEEDLLEKQPVKPETKAKEPQRFRIYSPLRHKPQRDDIMAMTARDAIFEFLQSVRAKSAQPVGIVYHPVKDVAPRALREEFTGSVTEILNALPPVFKPDARSRQRRTKPLSLVSAKRGTGPTIDPIKTGNVFSGAVRTLILDAFRHERIDDRTLKEIESCLKNSKLKRAPNWSDIPEMASNLTEKLKFAFSSADKHKWETINSLSAIAVSYASGTFIKQAVIFADQVDNESKFAAYNLETGKTTELNLGVFVAIESMKDAIEALTEGPTSEKYELLYIHPDSYSQAFDLSASIPDITESINSGKSDSTSENQDNRSDRSNDLNLLDRKREADRFSGAVTTLINDFLAANRKEAKDKILGKVDEIRQKGTNRPKWSAIPELFAPSGSNAAPIVPFRFAQAKIKNKKLDFDNAVDIPLDRLRAIAVSYKLNGSDQRIVVFQMKERNGVHYVAKNLSEPVKISFNSALEPESFSEAIVDLLQKAKVNECSVLFIEPPKPDATSDSKSSTTSGADSDSVTVPAPKQGKASEGIAHASGNLNQVTLDYENMNAWQTQGLAFETRRADNPLAGAVNTLVLHHIRDNSLLRDMVPRLLGHVRTELQKQKAFKWQDLQEHNIEVRFELASVTKKNLDLVYTPRTGQKAVRTLRVLAVRIYNSGEVGGDYVLFKVSDTRYTAVNTGTAEDSIIKVDPQPNEPNMDSALWRFLYAVKQTHCDILYIAA